MDPTIKPLITRSIIRVTQIAESLGTADAGRSPCAIVRNTTTANKRVTENPNLSPDSVGNRKTPMFKSARKITGIINVMSKNIGRLLKWKVYVTVGVMVLDTLTDV